jgi:hypothetical protein
MKTEVYPPASSLYVKPNNKKGKLNKKLKLNLYPRKQMPPELKFDYSTFEGMTGK